MKPNVFWYNECRGSWCHAIIEWLTADCEHIPPRHLKIGSDPVVVVFKADHIKNNLEIAKLNAYLTNFLSVLVFMTANEEGMLDPALIQHPRMRMWIQTPTRAQRQWASCGIPWGWTPGFDGTRWRERLPGYESTEADRMLAFSFAGQVTHERRESCIENLSVVTEGACFPNCLLKSMGFSRGLPRHLYFELLMSTKIVPCPSGPRTVDTFRVWEALEAGCIPIVDRLTPNPSTDEREYWDYILGPEHPIPTIWGWDQAERMIADLVENWTVYQPRVIAWWTERKAFWQRKFQTDLEMLQL